MPKKKRISGNFFTDVGRFLGWGGGKLKNRMKGKGKSLFHRIWEAMNR